MKIILIEIMKMRQSTEPSNRCIENILNAMAFCHSQEILEIDMIKD